MIYTTLQQVFDLYVNEYWLRCNVVSRSYREYNSKPKTNCIQQTIILSPFKLNIDFVKYKKIFNLFSKKIREGQTYQIKICTKYKNKSQINPVNFFWKLMKINSSPESFMIRDKDYSIVSCSPETLIEKKGNYIVTKPIAGTLKKNKLINKSKALNFFKNNIKSFWRKAWATGMG